jgi:hypothetical protein
MIAWIRTWQGGDPERTEAARWLARATLIAALLGLAVLCLGCDALRPQPSFKGGTGFSEATRTETLVFPVASAPTTQSSEELELTPLTPTASIAAARAGADAPPFPPSTPTASAPPGASATSRPVIAGDDASDLLARIAAAAKGYKVSYSKRTYYRPEFPTAATSTTTSHRSAATQPNIAGPDASGGNVGAIGLDGTEGATSFTIPHTVSQAQHSVWLPIIWVVLFGASGGALIYLGRPVWGALLIGVALFGLVIPLLPTWVLVVAFVAVPLLLLAGFLYHAYATGSLSADLKSVTADSDSLYDSIVAKFTASAAPSAPTAPVVAPIASPLASIGLPRPSPSGSQTLSGSLRL